MKSKPAYSKTLRRRHPTKTDMAAAEPVSEVSQALALVINADVKENIQEKLQEAQSTAEGENALWEGQRYAILFISDSV